MCLTRDASEDCDQWDKTQRQERLLGYCSIPLSMTLTMEEVCTLSKSVDDYKKSHYDGKKTRAHF